MKKLIQYAFGAILPCIVSTLAASELPQIPEVKAWRAAASSASQETTCKPVLFNDKIVYGNKTLNLKPDGMIQCVTPESGILADINMDFWIVQNGKADWGWKKNNLDKKLSSFVREGRKYTWKLWYSSKDVKPFHGITQILEVLPDDTLKFSANYSLPAPTKTRKFSIWHFGFSLMDAQWLNETINLDGNTRKITREKKDYHTAWNQKEVKWIFGVSDPVKKFSVYAKQSEIASAHFMRIDKKQTHIRFAAKSNKPDAFYTIYLDFRKCPEKTNADASRGNVNFKMQENMTLPDIHNRNMITNPSLECGLEGWHSPGNFGRIGELWYDPFHLDSTTAFEGKYSLRMQTFTETWPTISPLIGPMRVICDPGDYTMSFSVKGAPGCENAEVYCWIEDFHTPGRMGWPLNNQCKWKYKLTPEWKRHQETFHVPAGKPVIHLEFYGYKKEGKPVSFWIDAVQLERGKKATAFQPHPVEGQLLTSDPENFLSDKDKINGRLRIITAKPNAAGEIKVTVLNFFDEKLLELKKSFRTGADRTASVALPLDSLPGRGIFRVFAEYKLKTGEVYTDTHRYTKIAFQEKPLPNKRIFCMDYRSNEMYYDFLKRLKRQQKIGVGSKQHHHTTDKRVWDLEKAHGIEPLSAFLLTHTKGTQTGKNKMKFKILERRRSSGDEGTLPVEPKAIIWDYHVEAGGKVTPEYMEKLKQAVKFKVQQSPHVPMWLLGGELTAKYTNEWWGKGFTDQDVSHTMALLLKAFAEGVREGNPKAKVSQGDPCNMSPRGGIAETDRLLGECNKLGVKFDVISIHPYRYSPENPDLDDDTQQLFKVLKKHGYDNTPVNWPEMMHWGPFNIPQWGTQSSSWSGPPRTWQGGLISYDMSWTEKKSAAWYARSWLVALKYSDRILAACAGNTHNNSFMGVLMTPYASPLMANTLCALLGDAKFKKDVRFAPYMRTYIFEDAKGRPVAAVWNHHEDVDNGKVEAPFVTADFGNYLESVYDLMNSPRSFNKGKVRFQVNTFPLFFRGKPGTLKQMIAAFENAVPDSGKLFKPITISARPADKTNLKLTLKNSLSKDFKGTLNGKAVTIPASGEIVMHMPLPNPLKQDRITQEQKILTLKSKEGSTYTYDIAFKAFPVKHVDDKATLATLNWSKLPAIRIPRNPKNLTGGEYRMGWNELGLFVEIKVKDKKFVHVEYANPSGRWKNDAVQFYIDTFANARDRLNKGFDEDDYEYGLFPNSKGTSAQVFRYRSVEQQLGLATQAPPDNVFAPDIPCSFSVEGDLQTYRVFFPAKYLLPMRMQKGWAFGFAFTVANSDEPNKENGSPLNISADGTHCHNRPHVYPAAVLTE